jgi:lactate permease
VGGGIEEAAMAWIQVYDPLHNAFLSTLVAALPVIVLLAALGIFEVPAQWAALAGLVTTLLVAIVAFGMPAGAAFSTAVMGAATGLLPIGWIILAAIFLYNLTVETGQFEIIKNSVAALSPDRRVQALLIAFSFGAFIEGAAGFGTPVAITAAMMMGLGFRPLYAAGLALIANTAPVAFGAIGTPILTLSRVACGTPCTDNGLTPFTLGAMAGRQLPFISLLIPAWLVVTMSGWRGLRSVWPAVLVSGGSFALVQFFWSNFVGPELTDITGGLFSLIALAVFVRSWKPREIWTFGHERDEAPVAATAGAVAGRATVAGPARNPGHGGNPGHADHAGDDVDVPVYQHRVAAEAGRVDPDQEAATPAGAPHYGGGQVARAWVPWVILSVFVLLWGLPQVKDALNFSATPSAARITNPQVAWPYLDRVVYRDAPVLTAVKREDGLPVAGSNLYRIDPAKIADGEYRRKYAERAIYPFNWLSATGTGILFAALLTAAYLRFALGLRFDLLAIAGMTLRRLRWPLFTIACMLSLGTLTRYAGLDATLGLAFTRTGAIYPFFAALLGWLGVALTGSDTSSNTLFGSLQRITAQQLGLNQTLIVASNSSGGVMGKMIDAQSIVVSTASTNQVGQEGQILRFVFFHSIALACLMGLIVMLQAYVVPWMIP